MDLGSGDRDVGIYSGGDAVYHFFYGFGAGMEGFGGGWGREGQILVAGAGHRAMEFGRYYFVGGEGLGDPG